jgi:hypothetical protein
MFGHGVFYFSTIRKMVIYFGTIFNDLKITRTNAENDVVATLKVPLSYAPKDKMLARVDADPEITRQTAIYLPRMSFEMTGLAYDGTRKLNTVSRQVVKDNSNANKLKAQYNPVPYNFDFNLYVYVKNAEDGTKIIEQILPFFTPDWTATVNLIPEMNIAMDIPIILNSLSMEDTYDGSFEERRAIIWTLNFTVKGWIYGPIVSKPIIKIANTQFFVPSGGSQANVAASVGETDVIGRVTVKPGLDANGNPTSNPNTTINYSLIEVDDDFGYVITTEGIIMNE